MLPEGSSKASGIIRAVRDAIAATTQDSLRGLHITGSLASGGFDVRVSDIDLITTLRSDPSPSLIERLRAMHDGLAGEHPEWYDRIDVVYVAEDRLRGLPAAIPSMGVISPGEPLHLIGAGPEWILAWYPAREDSVTLMGRPLSEVVPPLPSDAFHEAIRARMRAFDGGIPDDATRGACAYTVMTICRGLHYILEGRRVSKADACEWAAGRYPEWESLLEAVVEWRANQWSENPTDPDAIASTRLFVTAMLHEVDG